jgi:hypothetical protein
VLKVRAIELSLMWTRLADFLELAVNTQPLALTVSLVCDLSGRKN